MKSFKQFDEAIERQAKDRKKLSQPHSVSGSRRDHSHDVDSALTDHVPGKGKGRIRKASKKEMRVSAMRDAGIEEAVKGQDTESRKEGAKERAADKKSGKIRKNTLDPKDYATQQKKSIEWHDKRTKGRFMPGQVTDVHEVAPPGWGHTKAEKEKTDPSKPKSKIGGTIAAMKRAQDRGDIPKKLNIFALAYSMKEKGYKPHYKPGTDEKYEKYKDKDEKNESVGFTIDSGEHKKASKKAKIRNLAKGNTNPNEKAAAEKKAGGPKLIGEVLSGKDTKKLAKASVLSTSDDPKKQDRARARQVEIDYKDLMDQRKKKKVGVGKSMREEKKSCPEGEYYCFDMGKCRPIPKGHKVREDGELVKEATTMRDNNLFGNAYAGLKQQKKKAIDAIPHKKSEEYRRNLNHKSQNEGIEIHDAKGNLYATVIDIIKPEPMKVPESPVKWKELTELTKLPNYNKTGNIIDVYLAWRGKNYMIQTFFPQVSKPSRKEVIDQIQKVYPGCRVWNYQVSTYNPGEPVLQIN